LIATRHQQGSGSKCDEQSRGSISDVHGFAPSVRAYPAKRAGARWRQAVFTASLAVQNGFVSKDDEHRILIQCIPCALFCGELSVPALPKTRYRPHAVYRVGK